MDGDGPLPDIWSFVGLITSELRTMFLLSFAVMASKGGQESFASILSKLLSSEFSMEGTKGSLTINTLHRKKAQN